MSNEWEDIAHATTPVVRNSSVGIGEFPIYPDHDYKVQRRKKQAPKAYVPALREGDKVTHSGVEIIVINVYMLGRFSGRTLVDGYLYEPHIRKSQLWKQVPLDDENITKIERGGEVIFGA